MMIATRFLKNAFWKTGMSPARLMNKAMHANENDDSRRNTMPLLRGDNLSRNLMVTLTLLTDIFCNKIKQESVNVHINAVVQNID